MEKKRKMENDNMKNWHHTPGPWISKPQPAEKPYKIYACDGRQLIATLPCHNGCMYIEDQKNVALVSAAPELLALLKRLAKLSQLTGLWDMIADRPLKETIEAVVAKAEAEDEDGK